MLCPEPWQAACEAADSLRNFDPEARQRALDQLRVQDPLLFETVEALLDVEQQAGSVPAPLEPFTEPPFGWSADQSIPLRPEGTPIGPYVLGPVLGVGAMGAVYRTERVEPYRQQVALKLMHATLDSSALRRFEAERQFLASLQHPGIVQLLDGGATLEGIPYLVTEFIDGPRLDEYASDSRHGVDDRVRIILQVAEAIAYAHGRNVLHRDLSPTNVLLTPEGAAKVTDFGLARPAPQAVSTPFVSDSGVLTGTAGYIAPERLLGGTASNGPALDIYALGALLYRVLAGRAPFVGTTAIQTCLMAAEREPAALWRIDPKLPKDLNTIVQKALARAPADRFDSADQFAAQLRLYLDREPLTIFPPTRRQRLSKWSLKNRKTIGTWVASMTLFLVCATGLLASWNWELRQERTALRQALQSISGTSAQLLESQPPGAGKTFPIYEQFVEQFDGIMKTGLLPSDPVLKRQVALMHFTQGRVCQDLENFQEAVAHLDRAIELLTPLPPLVAEPGKRRWYRFDLFRCYQVRAFVHERCHNADLALADYQSALPLIAGIEREEPQNPDWMEAEARLRVTLAGFQLRQGLVDEAEVETNRALKLATQAEALVPGQAVICNTLLLIHLRCADIAQHRNQPERVERELIEACEVADRVVDPGTYDWAVATARVEALHRLGDHYLVQARFDEARPLLEEALVINTEFSTKFPADLGHQDLKCRIDESLARCGGEKVAPDELEALSENP